MDPLVLPAAQGWHWVLQGFRVFRAYAMLWLLLLFFYWTALLVLSAIPVLGPLASMILMPGISAGLMVASRSAMNRLPPTLSHFYAPFAAHRKAQLQLGLVYLAGTVCAIGISALINGTQFFHGPPQSTDRAQMMRELPAYFSGMGTAAAAFLPTMAVLWFAPALVHWRNMSAGKAMFFSLFAGVRNWRAFLVYGLGWMFFLSVVPMIFAGVLAAVLTVDLRGVTVASFVLMPYFFAVLGAMACSIYATYADVFPQPEGDEKPAGAGES